MNWFVMKNIKRGFPQSIQDDLALNRKKQMKFVITVSKGLSLRRRANLTIIL